MSHKYGAGRVVLGASLGVGAVFALGLLFGASPAAADNGPHIATTGNTVVDRCAGCHRAHSAKATNLLNVSEVTLCATCHGSGGTGAATDVIDGIGYTDNGRGTQQGALRGGGFQYALIATDTGVNKTSIGVRANAQATTSAHSIDGTAQTAWGAGALGSASAGTSVNLQCGSCHDPHGNGNYRILRALPIGGTAPTNPATVGITNMVKNTTLSSGTTYFYDVTTAVANTFKVTDPVTIANSTAVGANSVVGATVKVVTDTTHLTISIRSVNVTATVTDGVLAFAAPQAILNASGNGTTVTYTTANLNGFVPGNVVTITGVNPTAYNLSKVTVASATTNSFTVANAATGTYVSGGTTGGEYAAIPDAVGAKVYTTTNYWAVDDHNYSGAYVASGTVPTAVLTNVSQWCSTCHNRYLAGAGAYENNSGDNIFTFRHRSQNGKENSPNCLQCHVAHGSNASMAGTESAKVTNPDGSAPAGSSKLLRVDNRGTCNMCHNV